MTDCNPAGATLNAAAAFVDGSPPSGFQQCAGFINTAADDVRWDWENNCLGYQDGVLFMRAFDDATGQILAGGRLFDGIVDNAYSGGAGRTYDTDSHEGVGLLANPNDDSVLPLGTNLWWFTNDANICSCGRPGGIGTCNDIFTANAANSAILYVGGNSSSHAYEAVYGPPGPKNTCSLNNETTALRVAIYVEQPVIILDLDIKPGSDDNPINLKAAKGVTPVAVYGSASFDATTIDVGTVAFGPDGATEAHGRLHVEDVNGDGFLDAVMHFRTGDIGLACGDTSATLTGQTTGGDDIEGTDSVQVKDKGC